jgi:hypothetical protein
MVHSLKPTVVTDNNLTDVEFTRGETICFGG